MAVEFIKKANLLSYAGTKCLNNDYAHHECTFCMDICPEDALGLVRDKFTIKGDACTSCAACLGSCPTEALTLETFDPNSFVLQLTSKEEKVVSCKKDSACLAAFDIHHFMTMSLKNDKPVSCDLSHCSECPMNKESALFDEIDAKISLANNYLAELGLEKALEKVTEKAEEAKPGRFAMFKKAHNTVKQAGVEGATDMFAQYNSNIPLKMVMLKNALREHMRDITNPKMKENLVFTSQEIDFDTCTNCGECAVFCPTDALMQSDDKQGILFKGGDCVGCGICHDICKANAIDAQKEFDIVNIIYDRVEELVHYEMAQCLECKCAYPYKGGDQICDRCKGFVESNEGLFTLAKDM